jgi:hypothetical protein
MYSIINKSYSHDANECASELIKMNLQSEEKVRFSNIEFIFK